jgi:hypothetical protein
VAACRFSRTRASRLDRELDERLGELVDEAEP